LHIFFSGIYLELSANSIATLKGQKRGMAVTNVILLIDSDSHETSVLQLALQLRGYVVLTAITASGGIEAASHCTKPIRLLLVDAKCPGGQVNRVVQQISARGHQASVLVMRDDNEKEESSHHPMILRPFSRAELARTITTLIGREI
jgi:DNA-binding response OmpR family regulator